MTKKIVTHLSTADLVMGGLIRAAGPYAMKSDIEGSPFRALARAIAHQQLNGTAANTILTRFINTAGTNGEFPTPQQVLDAPETTLRAAGFSFAKIASLRDLAAKTIEGVVPDRATLVALSNDEILERLTQVRGIGRWTVEMMLMFQLDRTDVLPVDDFGVRNGFRLAYGLRKMPHVKALALFGERWSPYRTAAAWYLWRAVDLHRAGTLPVPGEPTRLPRVPGLRRAVKRLKKKVAAKIVKVKKRVATATARLKASARRSTKARAKPKTRHKASRKKGRS
ncbi:MAG: DNA-3-methyladenine glycosylase 2 family protein [Gammaproteobacteria bacterium]